MFGRLAQTRVRRLSVAGAAAVLALAACASSAPTPIRPSSDGPQSRADGRPLSVCGQPLLYVLPGEGYATPAHLEPAPPNSPTAPAESVLPASVASTDPDLDGIPMVILSTDCAVGYTVLVKGSPYIRTVSVAYSKSRPDIVALALGLLRGGPRPAPDAYVYAYRDGHLQGLARVKF
jgi:hypothetical protein